MPSLLPLAISLALERGSGGGQEENIEFGRGILAAALVSQSDSRFS
jgi:hypothetical protein